MEEFLPLNLGNSDVILGVQWLEKLGAVTTNWKTQIMKFQVNGQAITLKGDPSLERAKVSLKTMIHTINSVGGGMLVQLNHLESLESPNLPSEILGFLTLVIEKYSPVFEWKGGLPPHRNQQHNITLKEGTKPVSARPYRYSHVQKA